MTHDEWFTATCLSFDERQVRWGQHFMNSLPNRLYIRLAGGPNDPFYSDSVPEVVYDFVSANWEDENE